MKIGIIGYGHVGQAMHKIFKNAVIFDLHKNIGSIADINLCDTAFICVPTPMNTDGSCHTDIVEDVIKWCECPLLILRSTIPVGFTKKMAEKYKKQIVFQPEYYGETVAHPFADLSERQWLAFGGTKQAIHLAIKTYQQVINSNIRIYQAQSDEMEMAKYMENAYLATKVTFCNEFYLLCKKMGVDYNQVREVWTADPRIGTSHTFVYEDNLGYGGSCLPKDISSIQSQAINLDCDMTLINAVIEKNKKLKKLVTIKLNKKT